MLIKKFQLSDEFPLWFSEEAFGSGLFSLKKNCVSVTQDICEFLKANGLNPEEILARGGFKSKEDIELILNTGWDYEGREGLNKRKDATYALQITEMDRVHLYEDPAYNPLFWIALAIESNHSPALALYDSKKMKLSSDPSYAEAKVYEFLEPKRKIDALVGLIEIEKKN